VGREYWEWEDVWLVNGAKVKREIKTGFKQQET